MSTLSKIFVVLNFVLALCFMIATLTLYSKKLNWVVEAQKNVKERNLLHEKLKRLQGIYDQTVETKRYEIKGLEDKITEQTGMLRERKQTIESLETKNNDLKKHLASFDMKLAELQTNLTRAQNKNTQLQTDIDRMRKERDTSIMAREFAETQAIETMADLKEAEAELMQISKRNHELVNRTLEQDILLNKAREQGFNPRMIVEGALEVPPIAGRILQVEEAVGIVILSVGKKDKTRTGMEFVISRGDKYVGKVRVRNVYEEMSSAVILQDLTREPIQVNDVAQTMN
jgi:DNA polymerase III alpha subunit (gram-positive type)